MFFLPAIMVFVQLASGTLMLAVEKNCMLSSYLFFADFVSHVNADIDVDYMLKQPAVRLINLFWLREKSLRFLKAIGACKDLSLPAKVDESESCMLSPCGLLRCSLPVPCI